MRIYGIDFTSVPKTGKPITCVRCELSNEILKLHEFMPFKRWGEFESFLIHEGPWIAGIDFPFGQPRRLIEDLDWPKDWSEYVSLINRKGKEWFENTLNEYKKVRQYGDKEHRRATDQKASSFSPMKLYRPPVGKMFFQGAPRLLKSNANILPCHPTKANMTIIEAYPGLAARNLIGREPYKGNKGNQSSKIIARENIIKKMDNDFEKSYGFRVQMTPKEYKMLVDDRSGDWLDAILCAAQAAWAYSQRSQNYGIPLSCDTSEGWIVDPSMI